MYFAKTIYTLNIKFPKIIYFNQPEIVKNFFFKITSPDTIKTLRKFGKALNRSLTLKQETLTNRHV